MTPTLVIRDDDISYFTKIDMLEQAYGRLWARGIPVSFSVIPKHNANVHVAHRPGNPFDPSIAPQYRGQDRDYPLTENAELCQYLIEKAEAGLVEICLHGCNHAYMEFGTEDPGLISDKLAQGKAIFKQAFPNLKISTFIAPYDKLSAVALELVLNEGYNISTMGEMIAERAKPTSHTGYEHLKLGTRHIFTCPEYLFNHRAEPEDALSTARQVLRQEPFAILTNHYWTFFYDWDAPTALFDAWQRLVDDLLARDDLEIMTFRQAAQGHTPTQEAVENTQ